MTREEGIILSAYTGYLLVDNFGDVHAFIEKILGRPVWSHELARKELQNEVREKCKHLLPVVKEEPRWIPVTERLPENDNYVLVIATGNFEKVYLEQAVEFATYTKEEGWVLEMWPEMENPVITYWMPVPDLPKEG